MKKRYWGVLAALIMIFAICAATVACSETEGEPTEYSVTVVMPDETPAAGIRVAWSQGSSEKGSASTDADGRAKVTLPAGTYSVTLSGYAEGLTFSAASATKEMRSLYMQLAVAEVEYTATVIDKTGSPVSGVKVNWLDGSTLAGTATTDGNGKAAISLDYGDYSVTVSDLPDGNIFDGSLSASGSAPAVRFELNDGQTAVYSVTLQSEGGLLFKKHLMLVYSGSTPVTSGLTDDNGVFSFKLAEGDYTVRTTVPDGYTVSPAALSASANTAVMRAHSEVIDSDPPSDFVYVIGDIIHDYSFTTAYEVDGAQATYTIADLLENKSKRAVILNNWGMNCSYCVSEMPAMQELYDRYGNVIEMIAVNNYNNRSDSDSQINAYREQYGYTFPMMRDKNNFNYRFNISGWPTTVIIDRYGAIARIERGGVDNVELWERMISDIISDDYVQTFVPGERESTSIREEASKPDVVLDPDHYEKVAETLNDTGSFPSGASVRWYGETEYELAWPFVLGKDPVVSPENDVMYSSNSGKANSMSIIYADVTAKAGSVLTFDYWAQTEKADILSIVWDGKIIKRISGDSEGWQTCYLYTDLIDGTHSLAMTYVKNSYGNSGKDNVYFRNVRFTELADMTGPTDMFRAAAYGIPETGATRFPHYAGVAPEADGYYHVDLLSLRNSEYAGNDAKPLLLVNLLNATNWSTVSLRQLVLGTDDDTGEYMYDCTLTIDGVTEDCREEFTKYFQIATASDVEQCVPVDERLHDLLVAFMAKIGGSGSHADEWLEACYFYSHYGDGAPIGNPILGLTEKTAIPVSTGRSTADMTRIMNPFTVTIYSFTPQTSGVYRMISLIPSNLATQYQAQIWLYDDNSSSSEPLEYCGDSHLSRDGQNDQNFEVHHYLSAGTKYYLALAFQMQETGTYDFEITRIGDSASVLEPCSKDHYTQKTDANGNILNEIVLVDPVDYTVDNDGYYRALNPDGTVGSYIYLDVKYANTLALGGLPLSKLVDRPHYILIDNTTRQDLDYKVFDFRYRIAYETQQNSSGEAVLVYDTKYELEAYGEKYKDYTGILKDYIAKAPESGENAGLVKVDQPLVDILTLYFETRINVLQDGVVEAALENEWLRFCWYYRQYDVNNK